ncbi:MAG TPA: hypothetical protein VGO62_06280 [Myxococcota bacterium]
MTRSTAALAMLAMLAVLAVLAVSASAHAAPPPPKSPRVQCGCPTPRLLEHKAPGVAALPLDDSHTISAWLHDGAHIGLFQQDEVDKQKLTPLDSADAPLVDVTDFTSAELANTLSRFVRVRATGPVPARAFLGILRSTDKTPRDVVAVAGDGSAQPVPPGPAPVVKALWLTPLEEHDRGGCGTWLTHRIAFELGDGSPAPEAFLVEDAHTKQQALVDARFAGVFGLGRVDVCEQGLAFSAGGPTHITVRPVSAAFGVGAPWRFDSDGSGQTDLVRTASPDSADRARIDEAFPVPGMDDHRGPSLKLLAVTIMSTVVGGALIAALIAFVIIPARKRRMKDIRCPSCGKQVPYDALDPKTDGFFCPACGAAGFWKGAQSTDVDVNRL